MRLTHAGFSHTVAMSKVSFELIGKKNKENCNVCKIRKFPFILPCLVGKFIALYLESFTAVF